MACCRKFQSREVRNIAWVIRFFLECHAQGFEILQGKAPFPGTEELAEMVAHVRGSSKSMTAELGTLIRSSGGVPEQVTIVESAEFVHNIVEQAGGFRRFVAAFRAYVVAGSREYAMLRDWSRNVRAGRPPRGKGVPASIRIADRFHSHPDTLRRQREKLFLEIAERVMYPDEEEGVAPISDMLAVSA